MSDERPRIAGVCACCGEGPDAWCLPSCAAKRPYRPAPAAAVTDADTTQDAAPAAGPEPDDEGNPSGSNHPVLQVATANLPERLSAAPAAAPVGDEGRSCPHRRVPSTGRCSLCRELDEQDAAARAPGDEGAARAAVAEAVGALVELCDESEAEGSRYLNGALVVYTDDLRRRVDRLRAALSAVSGEHREDEQ